MAKGTLGSSALGLPFGQAALLVTSGFRRTPSGCDVSTGLLETCTSAPHGEFMAENKTQPTGASVKAFLEAQV